MTTFISSLQKNEDLRTQGLSFSVFGLASLSICRMTDGWSRFFVSLSKVVLARLKGQYRNISALTPYKAHSSFPGTAG